MTHPPQPTPPQEAIPLCPSSQVDPHDLATYLANTPAALISATIDHVLDDLTTTLGTAL